MKLKVVLTLALLLSTVVLMSAFMPKQQQEVQYTNLKVLPKNISKAELDKVMSGFKTSLGVKCNFCHAPNAEGKMDFASDAKPEKDMARMMMKMTANINKKFFHIKDAKNPDAVLAVSCITCHNGKPHPETTLPEVAK
jgi:hypothetical protein